MPDSISSEYLRHVVTEICEKFPRRHVWNHSDLLGCQEWIEREMARIGHPFYRHSFTAKFWTDDQGTPGSLEVSNICLDVPGSESDSGTLVIGAHYDSRHGMEARQSRAPKFSWPHLSTGDNPPLYWDTPGANDNTSAVASLLALVESLKDFKPRQSLHFVFWVNEEYPFFRNYWKKGRTVKGIRYVADGLGSYYHARKLIQEDRRRIAGCIALDALGCYDDGRGYASTDAPWLNRHAYRLLFPADHDYVAFLSNRPSRPFAKRAADLFRKTGNVPVHVPPIPLAKRSKSGWSDDWSYWQFDVPAFCVTDTAFIRTPHYHQITDTPVTLNYPTLAKVVTGLRDVVTRMAS